MNYPISPCGRSGAAWCTPTTRRSQRENLITPGPSRHDRDLFGPKGKVYDGWETRRRREPGYDEVIVRLGAPGIVRGVVVDTAWFTGNYPPEVSVEGLSIDGHPDV